MFVDNHDGEPGQSWCPAVPHLLWWHHNLEMFWNINQFISNHNISFNNNKTGWLLLCSGSIFPTPQSTKRPGREFHWSNPGNVLETKISWWDLPCLMINPARPGHVCVFQFLKWAELWHPGWDRAYNYPGICLALLWLLLTGNWYKLLEFLADRSQRQNLKWSTHS